MIRITNREIAATTKPHHNQLPELWDNTGISSVTLDGIAYEFIREPEPVVMYTGSQLEKLFMDHEGTAPESHAHLRDLILARRAEMLRAMGSDELVGLCAEHIAATSETCEDEWSTARSAISLITEHIEAHRPELTDAVIDQWDREYTDTQPVDDGRGFRRYIAHRAAEYRSPAVVELRAENERLKSELELAWSDENDPLKAEVASLKKEVDVLRLTLADENLKLLENTLAAPQRVDEDDMHGILVQDGCIALLHRLPRGWACSDGAHVSGPHPSSFKIDPTRIFKVTSHPRGPLKVPSEETVRFERTYRTSIVERHHWFSEGAQWAIEWIKKANDAE